MMKLVVLSCVVAAVAAGGAFAPLAYTAPLAFPAPLAYTAPLAYAAPLLTPSNYRGPLSLGPGQPANILAADGRPLDTLEVNLDRYEKLTKSLNSGNVHLLKKRSAVQIAPFALRTIPVSPGAIAYSAPVNYYTPTISTAVHL